MVAALLRVTIIHDFEMQGQSGLQLPKGWDSIMSKDLTNKEAVFRIDMAGLAVAVSLLAGVVASHTTLANDQKSTTEKVEKIEVRLETMSQDLSRASVDIALIKRDLKHLEKQRDDIKAIRELLEQQKNQE